MLNLSLNPLWHTAMPIYQHAVGIATHCLSVLGFYLMLTKTPQSAKPFAKYLMLLQTSITLVDLNYGLLYCPIVLFPVPGALCNGILCTMFGFNGHIGASLTFFFVTMVGISIFLCYHYKYANIERMLGHESLQNNFLFRVVVPIGLLVPCILQSTRIEALEKGPLMVKNEYPSIYFLFEDTQFRAHAYNRTDENITKTSWFLALSIGSALSLYFIIGSFYRLSKQKMLSQKTKHMQQKAMVILLRQTAIPLMVLWMPVIIFDYSIFTCSFGPNFNNAFMCIHHAHALLHTSILIWTTPAYRNACLLWQRKKSSITSVHHLLQ